MKLDYMSSFGNDYKSINIDFSSLISIQELPPKMQISYEDINSNASIASFICYCYKAEINIQYISERSGFKTQEVHKIIQEAHELGIYEKLCEEFLKKEKK